MSQPLVSVVIPVYNRRDTIKRAVDSVLNQTYRNIELIIVDDGSTDGTIDVLKQLSNEKILIVKQDHKGANAARNLGIKKAKGEYIAFQDSDDEWLPEKLEMQIDYMIAQGYEVCYCAFYLFGKNRTEIIPSNYIDKQRYEKNLAEVLKNYNVVSTQTLVIHQGVILEIGGFDEEMPRLQDYEYVVRIIRKKQIGYIDRPLVKVYYSENSISSDAVKLEKAYLNLIKKHSDFLNVEFILKRCLGLNIDDINQKELHEKIQQINKYLKNYPEYEQIDAYEIAMDLLKTRYTLLLDSYKKEYEKRVSRLRTGEFAIYGAGKIGKKVLYELLKRNLRPQYFLVTKKIDFNELHGIPVIELEKWEQKNQDIIIGVSTELQFELIENLVAKGYTNYFRYPGIL